jgi:flagellar biosynthetic protein FlhB
MAEHDNDQDRSLEASAKRLEDARREGQVPRSRDLAHFLVVGASAAVLALAGASIAGASRDLLVRSLTFDRAALDPTLMGNRLGEATVAAVLGISPVLLVLAVAGAAAPLLVGGWIFSPRALAPRFERLDPASGLGRLFSLQSIVGLGKNLLLAGVLALAGTHYLWAHLEDFASLAALPLPAALRQSFLLLSSGFAVLVGTLVLTAAIDVPWQIAQFRKRLRMTVQELRQEEREQQGDPHLKARIRRIQRDMARRRMMAAVPKADVVVTNPSHFAVAIKYLEDRHRAPVVVAKGMDSVAARIRELARESGVPQLEAPPLARALYRHVELGEEVPAALYTAVAQVLAWVFQLRRHRQGLAPRPGEPVDLPVPDELDPLAPRARA